MKRWIRDVIYGIALLIISVVLWVEANSFVQNVIKEPAAKPSTYAHIWSGLLAVLAVVQLVRAFVKRPDEERPRIFTPLAIITLVSLVAYVLVIRWLGFLLTTFLLMAILLISYSYAMGKIDKTNKNKFALQILKYLVIAFAISFLVQYLFVDLLGAKLPKGKFF